MDFVKIANYRVFVRTYLNKRAPRGHGEITKLAKHIGVHAAFVSQVLGETKEFNMEQAFATAEYLQLTEAERKYFLLLWQRDRAGTKELRKYLESEIAALLKSLKVLANRLEEHRVLSDEDRAIFYSSWLYSGIRLYCSIGAGKTLEDICAHFDINRKKALDILDFMTRKELLVAGSGRYKMGSQHTHLPKDSVFNTRSHMNWRTKALQRHENMAEEEIAFTAPMSIAKADFLKIREKIFSCIQESIAIAKESEAEDVAFLNIDWLWINSSDSV